MCNYIDTHTALNTIVFLFFSQGNCSSGDPVSASALLSAAVGVFRLQETFCESNKGFLETELILKHYGTLADFFVNGYIEHHTLND